MPAAKTPRKDVMTDSWGRANRSLNDKACPRCGKTFRPLRSTSRYCSRACSWANNGGHNAKEEVWWINSRGYVEGRIRTAEGVRLVKQHREVAAEMLGRDLLPGESVHHKNGDKSDNRPENLAVISHGEHSRHHNNERTYQRGYKLNLSDQERTARAERMQKMRRAAIAKALGEPQ